MDARPTSKGLSLVVLVPPALLIALIAPGAALASFRKDETPLPASVADGGAADSGATHASTGGGAFVRMVVGLFIVLAVIYGVYWLLKTYGKSKKSDTGDGKLDVVATTVLAPNRTVHLVRVGEELVLLGAAEQSVTPLRVYDAAETRRLDQSLEAPRELRAASDNRGEMSTIARMFDDLRRRTARA